MHSACMTSPLTTAHLPAMNTHIEGTPALVAQATDRLTAMGAVVLPATVHYTGSGYAAIETDFEDVAEKLAREIDDAAHASKRGQRLLWGYVGPMTHTVTVSTRGAKQLIELLGRTADVVVDRIRAELNWTYFRTNATAQQIYKLSVLTEVPATANQLPGRFGMR